MVKLFSLKSPDEWATTKQACRDTYVVTCFLPSTIRIYIYIYINPMTEELHVPCIKYRFYMYVLNSLL